MWLQYSIFAPSSPLFPLWCAWLLQVLIRRNAYVSVTAPISYLSVTQTDPHIVQLSIFRQNNFAHDYHFHCFVYVHAISAPVAQNSLQRVFNRSIWYSVESFRRKRQFSFEIQRSWSGLLPWSICSISVASLPGSGIFLVAFSLNSEDNMASKTGEHTIKTARWKWNFLSATWRIRSLDFHGRENLPCSWGELLFWQKLVRWAAARFRDIFNFRVKDSLKNRSDLTCTLRACSILRSETKRNEIYGRGRKNAY